MRHMLFSGRHSGSDYSRWVTPAEAFRAGTSAIRAVAPDYDSVLTTGGAADILFVDFDQGALAGAPMTVESLVRHADGRSVRALMIDSVWLYRNGRIEIFDEAEVIAEAKSCAEMLRAAGQEAMPDLLEIHSAFGPWYRRTFSGVNCPQCGRLQAVPSW
jgi:cytosine/adenosine deaminase-related metal-dependent hydrolase